MNVSVFIARRLGLGETGGSVTDGSERKSPAVAIAVVGIAVSVVIMMLTLAIVPGFKHQITRKVMGFDAQVTMHPVGASGSYDGSVTAPFKVTDSLVTAISTALPADALASYSIRMSGVLKTDGQFAGLVFKAYDGSRALDFIAENLEEGAIPAYSDGVANDSILISRVVASNLGLTIGDKVYGYFFNDGRLRMRRFVVSAIYNTHFNEYDKLLAFMSIGQARGVCGFDTDECTAVEIRGLNNDDIESVKERMQEVSSEAFYTTKTNTYLAVSDVYEQDPMYFNWLDLLDTNVIVILILMGCVSAVTLISCLVIMILERVRLVGILKALGGDNGMVSRVFLFLAGRVVLRGLLIGDAIALVFMWLQWRLRLVPLDAEAYYLNAVPIEFDWMSFLLLNIGVVTLSLIVLLIPVRMVARISPSRVMRFE